jgi:hypothetical protein
MVLCEKLGYSDEQRRELAGVASFKELTKPRATTLIDEWEKLASGDPGVEQAAPATDDDKLWDANQSLDFALATRYSGNVARKRWLDTKIRDLGKSTRAALTLEEVNAMVAELEKATA